MELPYWLFEDAVPSEVCDIIIKDGMDLPPYDEASDFYYTSENLSTERVCFLSDRWINGIIRHHVDMANLQSYKFDITYDFQEKMQFIVYGEQGFFGWHHDVLPPEPSPIYPRKLTSILMLSDTNDFEGGELELFTHNDTDGQIYGQAIENFNKGSLIVFPAASYHRVRNITKGKRITLVHWTHGPKLK